MEQADLVIVGAGWHGLAMGKVYTEVFPNAKVMILDSASSIGGVWASERLYPGLKTNNLVGSYEFGDFPMVPQKYGIQPGQHIPGAVVHEYLVQFADNFNLTSRIHPKRVVNSARLHQNGDWILEISTKPSPTSQAVISEIIAKKLVVATGLTSQPFIPKFPGQESFTGKILHSIQLKARSEDIQSAKEVLVLGGNKSAWDVCFSAAKAGAHVNMVMRPSGGGPSWVWPVFFTRYKLSIQRLASTRIFSWFDPCIWAGNDRFNWIRTFLHKTWIGRILVARFWKLLANIVVKANGYDTHPELAKLKPWISPFWMGNSLGIHNYETNWFEFVRQGRITVHIADITSLSSQNIHLSNGSVINADTFVCCTGWEVKPPIRFLPEELGSILGIPNKSAEDTSMATKARSHILEAVPDLRFRPNRTLPITTTGLNVLKESQNRNTPYQLYRFLVPSNNRLFELRNLAFIGAHLSITATMVAQAQALWITAYFENEIPHLKPSSIDHEAVQYETILHSQHCRMRHPAEAGGSGERCPDLVFDSIPYIDLLLRDLGIEAFRKKGVWSEIFDRYYPNDYKDIVTEWIQKRKSDVEMK